MISLSFHRSVAAGLLLMLAGAGARADALLDEAKALLAGGNARQAYALLAPQEDRRAGEPDFDYLLGITALDSGKAGLAVFALERVVAVQPGNAEARAELARAYFELRDNVSARTEFENVKKSQPPAAVSASVDKFLTAIEQRFASANAARFSGYLAFTGGYDSNINSATSDDIVAIPALGNINFILSDAAKEQSEGFGEGELGLAVAKSLNPNWHVFANSRGRLRFNRGDSQFETRSLDASAGTRLVRGDNAYTAMAQWQRYDVGRHGFRRTVAGTLQWQHNLTANTQASVYGQVAHLHYLQDAQEIRDSRLVLAGLAFGHTFDKVSGSPTLFASGYGAREHNRAGVDHLGRTYFGLRAGGRIGVRGNLDALAGFAYQFSDYGGEEPLFGDGRIDRYYELSAGLEYRPARGLTLSPKITYTINDSNIPLNDYDRIVAAGTVRYDF